MFSGIIENLATVYSIGPEGANRVFWLESSLAPEFKIDQSISHNGVCLTVEEIKGSLYRVTAIGETLEKSNIGSLKAGSFVNIERSIRLQDRLDGHIVQGHTDGVGICKSIKEADGSWVFSFEYDTVFSALIIEKGSVAVNGVSLTAFGCIDNLFSVAIIPFTWAHTNFQWLRPGSSVNLEFDILGKYVQRWLERGSRQ